MDIAIHFNLLIKEMIVGILFSERSQFLLMKKIKIEI
jgi:hypothetical protein